MTNEFKKYVLKNVPTKILLGAYKNARVFNQIIGFNNGFPVFDRDMEEPVHVVVGRFAYWNPYKGHGCTCIYTSQEVKNELDIRENVA